MDNYCGKRLDGRYEIKEIIGVGGMAVVYKAYDNIDDRIVAIKILKQELLENEEFRRRFKNESKAIAVLSHPNIVKVYDVSFGDRLQYIVMEYIEGITLKEYIEQQGYINWKDAVHFLTQILRALQHAHDKGIIHRDIKPQNIMLLQDGTIKVTDFGIARFSRGDTKTLTESAIGSVHYISPEQARGEVTDDKADIYSVGVVLYEMLTGQLPFQSDSAVSVAIMQLQQEAKRPREINPEIPIGLEQITLRAMQKNTRDRYHSAAEMLMDIDQFKKNPAIKFDYSYFVDKEPTKYVGAQRGNNVPISKPVAEETEEDEYDGRKKAIAIVGGIAAGLAVLALIIVLFVSLGQKVELPNFVGMNYNDEIFENEKYKDFVFVTQNVNDETKELGTVIEQSPNEGTKVRKKSKVILKIAFNDENVLVDNVVGKTADEAKKILEEKGFVVSIVEVYDKLSTAGLVFKTFPSENTYAERGSTVTVYVATDESENAVKVPAVVGDSADIAKELIEKVGLVCKVEEVNNAENKGMVISQSPDGDTSVEVGSTVTIKVSNGIPESSNATVSFTLPKGVGDSGTIKYYLNDNLYKTEKDILFSGKSKSIEVKGSGDDNTFVVTANDKKIYECKIDFTKVPGVVSDGKDFAYTDDITLPNDLVEKLKAEAESELKAAGFTNIVFKTVADDTIEEGRVIKTDPAGGSKYPAEKKITVYISSGPEVEEPDTDEGSGD
ncbi:MAG: Stk1 family PASTA domain-containing Ser/Thr kinase [Clostridiales bacterium]|nr:Stk1 family PASTA domain-containing Ser/Thr kinase [Clostridiales bacterium]